MKKIFTTIITLTLILCACASYKDKDESISANGLYFDTVINVTIYDASRQDALDGCLALAEKYEHYFSAKLPDSDVSLINSHPNQPVKVHKETAELITKALSYGKLSDGDFDITIGKLSDIWAFTQETDDHVLPDPKTIEAALAHVDYRKVVVDGDEITLGDEDSAIDLGGIAKGYIADKMKEYLLNEGIDCALINLGGNVLAIGEKPDNDTFTIGIQRPFFEDGKPIASVDVKDMSVVTSGTYQRFFTVDGKKYHHILDPKTGYPCDNGLASVTIICPSSADGDALSTSVFLMGADKGLSFIEGLNNTEAVFVTTDDRILFTSGIGKGIPYKEYP